MITLLELNKAINETIEKAVSAAVLKIPIVAEALSKPIIRPSIKIILEDASSGKLNSSCRERTLTYRVYFFPQDKDRPKLEILKVQEIVEYALIKEIQVNPGFMVSPEEVSSEITDGVLVCSFDIYLVELLLDNDRSDIMEELNYR